MDSFDASLRADWRDSTPFPEHWRDFAGSLPFVSSSHAAIERVSCQTANGMLNLLLVAFHSPFVALARGTYFPL